MAPRLARLLTTPLVTLLAVGATLPAYAQFVDRTASAGLTRFEATWGAAFSDLDLDGDLDLYAGHHTSLPTIFWNDGTGFFDANTHPAPWAPGAFDRHGVLAISLNSNERIELFIAHGAGGGETSEPNEVYRNDGGGFLISIGGAAGMADALGRARAASAADFDGDFDVDVWVGKAPDPASPNSLFRNDGPLSFHDVASSVGLDEMFGTVGGVWGDYDADGDPDLFTGGEEFARPSTLWRNDGGAFTDVTAAFAPSLPIVSGADWGDMDGDGDLDLALVNGDIGIFDTWSAADTLSFFFNTRYADTGIDGLTIPSSADTLIARVRIRGIPNPMLVFLGPSGVHPPATTTFPLTDAYVGAPTFTPGVSQGIYLWRTAPGGDWELRCSTPAINFDTFDGWFAGDAPITNVTEHDLEDAGFVPGTLLVYRNDGATFVDASSSLLLPPTMLNPRDVSWVDYDNDGDLDLHVVDMGTSASPNAPDRLLRNDAGTFADVTALEGVAGGTGGMGDGAVWGDVDDDGDLDLYVAQGAGPTTFNAYGPALFLRNEGNRGNSIQLELVGRESGVTALGATATVYAGGLVVTRTLTANSWRGFQDPLRMHFGIGAATVADSIRIDWPSGIVHEYVNTAPGVYRIFENFAVLGAPNVSSPADAWSLGRPRPQPSRGAQTVSLTTEHEIRIELAVFDVAGRLVRRLHDGLVPAGETAFRWDGRDGEHNLTPAGVYFFRARTDTSVMTWKSVRVR
jgi:hypothetical protein